MFAEQPQELQRIEQRAQRVSTRAPSPHEALRHEPDVSTGDFSFAIVGESNYQRTIQAAGRDLLQDDEGISVLAVRVQCEPDNPHDGNAVRVSTMRGETLGYLARADAERYCGAIGAVGGSVICRARLFGGTSEKPSIGVWLDLCEPDEI